MKKIITFIGNNIKNIESFTSNNFILQLSTARFFSHDMRTCIQIQEDDITENYWKRKAQMNFNRILPDIIDSLTTINDKNSELIPAYKWLVKELQKNLIDSDKNCGLTVLQSYQILMNNSSLEPETERLVQIMGWCAEMLRKSVIASSSSVSNSDHVLGGCQETDMNKVLHSSLNQLLWQYFYSTTCFSHILHLFHKVNHFAIIGQVLDKETHSDKTLNQFTMNRYSAITKYKTSYNTFALPLLLSFYMANVTDEEIHRQAKTIALEMGHFYQVQKDYYDCYANEASNISNGRCDWLSVVALQRVNPDQKQILLENYGKGDSDSVNKVKELYEKIGIPKTYKTYEDHTYDLLCTQIQQSSRGLPHILFFKMMERFYVKN